MPMAKFDKIQRVNHSRIVMAVAVLLTSSLRGDEVIRSLDALRTAQVANQRDRTFEISGRVVIPPSFPRGSFAIVDKDSALTLYDMRPQQTVQMSIGDKIIVSGRTEPSRQKPGTAVNCYALRLVEHGTLPDIPPIRLKDFLSGKSPDNRRAAFHGILQDVFPDDIDDQYIYAVLKDEEDIINLICNCPRTCLPGFRNLLGCEVIVSGIATGNAADGPRALNPSLRISGTNSFHVVSRPTRSPFDVPELQADRVTDPRLIQKLGPRLIRGTVLATWGDRSFLLKTLRGQSVCVDLADGDLPPVRASVEAVGIVETDLCDISLTRAFWRPSDQPVVSEEKPESFHLLDLFTSGRRHATAINVKKHGRTLSIRGTVKSIAQEEDGSCKILLADGVHVIQALCAPHVSADLEEGSVVRVTGICVKDSDVWRPSVPIPRIRGLFLVVRSANDIVVLKTAPWWTPVRFALVLTVLLAILVAVFIWNASLRILIERRSREVIKAQTAKIESELRIDERTRLAAELHDNTVQNLTAIAYRISAAHCALGDRDGDVGRILLVAAKMLKSCRTNLRRCLWDLRSDALGEPDFGTAIRRTVETVAGDARLSIRFAGRRELISDTTAHAVLNILRELVSNATVHGQASAIVIAGEARPDFIRFSVKDNGTGFEPSTRPGQDDGHFGLDGIHERLERLGGKLIVNSAVGQGTYIRIDIRKP